MSDTLSEQLETEEAMFVQTAQGIESAGGNLTLRGITPLTPSASSPTRPAPRRRALRRTSATGQS